METVFRLRSDLRAREKINIAIGVVFMVFLIVVFVRGLLGEEITKFQLFCLVPALFFSTIYQISESYYQTTRERLVISPAGLDYQSFEYGVFSEWQTLRKIGHDPAWLRRKEECIISESRSVKDKVPFWRMFGMKRINYIPVSRFSREWRKSEFGRQIERFAPHLFQ